MVLDHPSPLPPTRGTAAHQLDNAVRASLLGPHARFAQRRGNVLRYRPDVARFVAFPDAPGRGRLA